MKSADEWAMFLMEQRGHVVIAFPTTTVEDGYRTNNFARHPLKRGYLEVIAKTTRRDWDAQAKLIDSVTGRSPDKGQKTRKEKFFRCRYIIGKGQA